MSSQTMQMAWQFNWESQPIAHAQQQRQNSQKDHCRHVQNTCWLYRHDLWLSFPTHERLTGSGPSILICVVLCLHVGQQFFHNVLLHLSTNLSSSITPYGSYQTSRPIVESNPSNKPLISSETASSIYQALENSWATQHTSFCIYH